ncbi:hypothetical protein HPO96_28585 [Kribbella sandramycini]|uniref:Uncharacterized protein n=1 Tax=Kribbella sandramycini TaxID=60450 RepID=A0A7Y4P1X9_9ACTN|nr:hypothetical protein [Kribbella sandramycini]MBB6571563.1 hypothetical protein [Kribbella sandramycini]NOL44211.1 hypothetical protein [Kribbella sandramycini]
MNTTITTLTKLHASSWELAADIDRVDAVATTGNGARLTDSSALTIAAGWQSPGYRGSAFAELAGTGSVDLNDLAENILHAHGAAKTEHDRHTLDLLLLWAYHHPSLDTDEEDCSYDD